MNIRKPVLVLLIILITLSLAACVHGNRIGSSSPNLVSVLQEKLQLDIVEDAQSAPVQSAVTAVVLAARGFE